MYTEKELVGIAKRENNNKRKFLVVNRLQGKHVPADPQSIFKMYDELAACISKEYQDEKLLLIGFAETATAIGARLAIDINSFYMQTTRENIENVEYLYFTEAHSHATEQKLIKTDLDKVIDLVQRIVFVEDEVTTGNTILKAIDTIKNAYEKDLSFSAASILNGMDENSVKTYDEKNIKLHYLVKTEQSLYSDMAEKYYTTGVYHTYPKEHGTLYPVYDAGQYLNARRLHRGSDYKKSCISLYEQILQWVTFKAGENILVIGTEEFMYPAIFVSSMIKEMGCKVKSHSTTRSPVMVSSEEQYPLHERYEIHSFYDDERRTFIYDLKRYDKVVVITDSQNKSDRGIRDLCCGLEQCGNSDISIIRWCE